MTTTTLREQTAPGVFREVVRVPMRDGVDLVADLHRDGTQTPRPVVLERTPYGRRHSRGSDQNRHDAPVPLPDDIAAHFVRAGFHVVRQDCRGRGDSGGEFVKYLNEGPDGADTVEWISAQPWCDGRVVMTGVSYSAHVQTAAAAENPAGMAALFCDSGGFASAYEAGMRMGGAFELKQATWAFNHAAQAPEILSDPVAAAALAAQDLPDWFTAMPWRPGSSPLRSAPSYEDYLLEQWRQSAFGDYWRQPAIYARGSYDAFPDVPSVHVSSWYDPYVRSTIENFTELGRRKGSPSFLVMGPWTHGSRCATFSGDVDFGPAATFDGNVATDYLTFRSDWFRSALAGTAAGDVPRVQYFLMGGGDGRRDADGRMRHGGSWSHDEQWPPTGARETPWYLSATGELRTTPVTERDRWVEYDHDPRHPVPTIGGQVTSGEPVMTGGAYDQRPDHRTFGVNGPHLPLAARPDVVSLSTPPLTEPVTVAGPVRARIFLSSSAVDTDLTIKLVDVHPPNEDYPEGFAMNLTDGILRCRFRDSFEDPTPLEPGRVYEVEVVAPDTANVFGVGHRIRLDVSSSNFPRFDVNLGTGTGEAEERRAIVAANRLHLDAGHPSRLLLHVVDLGGSALSA